MKLQQAFAPLSSELDLELVAKQNFEARNVRGDRAWSRDQARGGRPVYVLSERERAEFIEQARYQLELRGGAQQMASMPS
jgi:hypothetical protein